MAHDVVPSLTVQQRLFADRWWANGGDLCEAVDFAGYKGLSTRSELARKGRQLLSLKRMKDYMAFLRRQAKRAHEVEIVRKAAIREQLGQDLRSVSGDSGTSELSESSQSEVPVEGLRVEVGGEEGAVEGQVGQLEGQVVGIDGQVNGQSMDLRAGDPRLYTAEQLGTGVAVAYGRELTPQEVRELLARVARGAETGMRDARTRLRAIELAMKNMGMLVDLSFSAKTDLSPAAKALSAKERSAEIERLEGYLAKVKEGKAPTSE